MFFLLCHCTALPSVKLLIMNLFVCMWQCDLLEMPAVAQLENDSKYSLIYQLLEIFLTQRLDAYLDFEAANSALLKSYGKICLLTINRYGSRIVVFMKWFSMNKRTFMYGSTRGPSLRNHPQKRGKRNDLWIMKSIL